MAKYHGNGTTLSVSTNGSTASATAIGGIMGLSVPGGSAAKIDTTTLDSTSNYQTAVRGFRDAGDMTFEVAYDPANAGWTKVKAMDASGLGGTFTIAYASTSLSDESHKAYVSNVGREIPRDTMITRPITVTFTSGPGFN